jgi:hypothetical protein
MTYLLPLLNTPLDSRHRSFAIEAVGFFGTLATSERRSTQLPGRLLNTLPRCFIEGSYNRDLSTR